MFPAMEVMGALTSSVGPAVDDGRSLPGGGQT